jgi:small subunit ribosomal protein S17
MKNLQGTVTSLKMAKTAVVEVERMWKHPLYKKAVKRSKKYACDFNPEKIKLALGDMVEISETTPVSKTKRFKVVNKIEK